MTILEVPFYHNSIRTYSAIFGTVFNDLKIVRKNGKVIKVPLAYASRQKFDMKEREEQVPDIKTKFPRMGFVLTGWEKDKVRGKNPLNRISDCNGDKTTGAIDTQYNPVPYKFLYELRIGTKNLDDMLQILEQILVWFDDSIEVVVKDNPDLNKNTNVRIELLTDSLEDNYEGSFEEEKVLEVSLSFALDGYLYKPTVNTKTITKIDLSFFDMGSEELDETITITPA